MEYSNDEPMIETICLIFGDLLTKNVLSVRVRCSHFLLNDEIFIYLQSSKYPRNSIFCVGVKTNLSVCVENLNLLSKSIVAFILSYYLYALV